jgi:putative endonuclease
MTNKRDSVLYIGFTKDLARRVAEHKSNDLPGFTADYRCAKLIYWEYHSEVRDAIQREKQLKKWSRAKKIALISKMNPRCFDLSEDILGQ